MKREKGNAGIGIFGLMGVIFVVLKIMEVKPIAEWSWWWVTAPFWGGFAVVFVIMAMVLAIAAVATRR